MKYTLRPYQNEAVAAAIAWVKKNIEPCLIEAATGAGKSLIIAEIARILNDISKGKHILCLAPSAELVEQNIEKYKLTGNPASIYSASAGQKCLRHPVVFATPGTFKKVARRMGSKFCAVMVDEAQGMTPTVREIISEMKTTAPNLRVIGLTATPYVMGGGYIYLQDEEGGTNGPDTTKDPYFLRKIFTITTEQLLAAGYLTPVLVGKIGGDHYETAHLEVNSLGKFDAHEVDKAFVGHGRKTASIVADIVAKSRNRKSVLLFASTVAHAHEVMASLPPELSAMVTGATPKPERKDILKRFKAGKIKYLVNVDVLTVGFDAPCIDVIALLRATESAGLLQQIIGRGLRLFKGKDDVLLLDYAENLVRHCPEGNIFKPKIRARKAGQEAVLIPVECPDCHTTINFSQRPNEMGYEIDRHGYYTVAGSPVTTALGPVPAHYGRRCPGMVRGFGGQYFQCDYRWTSKPCPVCCADNDIAARYCTECRAEIIDPNERLAMEFKALKRDPTRTQTDEVESMDVIPTVSRSGNECLRVDFKTPYRNFSVWFMPEGNPGQRAMYEKFRVATEYGPPLTVTYRRESDTAFYKVLTYNLEADHAPEPVTK